MGRPTPAGAPGALRRRPVRVRRSPHLVAYWRGSTLVACNYATGLKAELPPKARDLLGACGNWTPVSVLAKAGFVPRDIFPALIDRLIALELLERSDRPRDPRAVAMDRLQPWNPQVGFFHATTRDVPYSPRSVTTRHTKAKAAVSPPPPTVKRYPGVETIELAPPPHDEFAAVLRARRTWRRYSSEPVTRDELATALALASGIQQWIEADLFDLPLKTSPSGGQTLGRVLPRLRTSAGCEAGIYYAPDRHALRKLAARSQPPACAPCPGGIS